MAGRSPTKTAQTEAPRIRGDFQCPTPPRGYPPSPPNDEPLRAPESPEEMTPEQRKRARAWILRELALYERNRRTIAGAGLAMQMWAASDREPPNQAAPHI
jgi:hypothetical protein